MNHTVEVGDPKIADNEAICREFQKKFCRKSSHFIVLNLGNPNSTIMGEAPHKRYASPQILTVCCFLSNSSTMPLQWKFRFHAGKDDFVCLTRIENN